MELEGFGRRMVWILWPAFIVGGVAEVIFFTLFDPMDLPFSDLVLGAGTLGEHRMAVYSIGFFIFWGFAAASSAFTCFLQRTSTEVNRCPLTPSQRPAGCPKRESSDA